MYTTLTQIQIPNHTNNTHRLAINISGKRNSRNAFVMVGVWTRARHYIAYFSIFYGATKLQRQLKRKSAGKTATAMHNILHSPVHDAREIAQFIELLPHQQKYFDGSVWLFRMKFITANWLASVMVGNIKIVLPDEISWANNHRMSPRSCE